jgi:DnaJ-class molecular chaperone
MPVTYKDYYALLGVQKTASEKGGFGDECVRLISRLPHHSSERERELFRELAAVRPV